MSLRDIVSYDPETKRRIREEIVSLQQARAEFRHADREFTCPPAGHVSTADLKAMAGLQELFFTHHFTSHRRWFGPWIVFGKRLGVSLLNRLLKISLVRQVELNQHLWNLALSVQHLEQRVLHLEQQLRQARPEVHL